MLISLSTAGNGSLCLMQSPYVHNINRTVFNANPNKALPLKKKPEIDEVPRISLLDLI